MNQREEITQFFEKTYNFKPVLSFQRKAFRDQRKGWYLRLGWSDGDKVYLGPHVGRALGKITHLSEETLERAENYAIEVAERQNAQWEGTRRGGYYK